MATEAYTKIDDMWRSSTPYIKVNGVWKQPDAIYQKINGSWKLVWGTEDVAFKTFGFRPYKHSPSSSGNLYGFLGSNCEIIYSNGYSNYDDIVYYEVDELWQFYHPRAGETYTVKFAYPPTSGQSGKKVYIYSANELGIANAYEIVDANKINTGSYNLYFNGSTFTIVT